MADLDAIADRINSREKYLLASANTGDDGQEYLRLAIHHNEWRTTNLHPSMYERILAGLSDHAWVFRDFEVRQKPAEDHDRSEDVDFVVIIIEVAPASTADTDEREAIPQ